MASDAPLAARVREIADRIKARRAAEKNGTDAGVDVTAPPPFPEPAVIGDEPTNGARPGIVFYSHPFPDLVPNLGPRRVTAFTACRDCETDPPVERTVRTGAYAFTVPGDVGTWTAYGERPLCRRHAGRRAGRA